MKKKIGLLGGTFNPIHAKHLAIAVQAKEQFELNEVWFVPANIPPHKHFNQDEVSVSDRLTMIELAIKPYKDFHICDLELQQTGVSYSAHLVRQLKEMHPEFEFYFIIGGDNVAILSEWYDIEYLLSAVHFIGVPRQDFDVESPYGILWLDIDAVDNINSSDIRSGKLYRNDVVPETVFDYMISNQLYCYTRLHYHVYRNMSYYRFIHVLGVVETAERLALQYVLDVEKCKLAALLHDYAKEIDKKREQLIMEKHFSNEMMLYEEPVWHSFVGSYLVQKELGILDSQVVAAIRYHVTAHPDMDTVAQCLFVADYIEPGRKFPGVNDARTAAFTSLSAGVVAELEGVKAHLLSKGLQFPELSEQALLKFKQEV